MTAAEVRDRLTDFGALALTLFGEARGEPIEGIVAVGSVVRNRVERPRRYSSTFRGVCVQPAQFSCWWLFGGETNYERVYGMARAFVEGRGMPLEGSSIDVWRECQFVAEGLIGGQVRDRVAGATHYYAPAGMQPMGAIPIWAEGLTPAATIGRHLFFAGVK